MYQENRGNRFLRVLNHPVIVLPEDIEPITLTPDPGCGVKGIRSTDHPCDVFDNESPYVEAEADCDTDGHYLCDECRFMSQKARDYRAFEYPPGSMYAD